MQIKKFVFYIPEYVDYSNGIRVLYEAAWLFSKYTPVNIINYSHSSSYNRKKIPSHYNSLITKKLKTLNSNTVFFFPESLIEDPLPNIEKKVVRYFLSKPFILNSESPKFENDYCVSYSNLISNEMPQLFLLDPKLKELTMLNHKKSHQNKKAIIYFGKIRPSRFYLNKHLLKLLECFSDIEIVTRTIPSRREDLYRKIGSATIVISLDPLTSLIHESLLLGTPCLVADNIFDNEYKNFNIKFYDLYFESDIAYLIKLLKKNSEIKTHRMENIKILRDTFKLQDENFNRFKHLLELNINKIDIKKNQKIKIDFSNYYKKKWHCEPVMNFTSINSIIYQFIFFNNNYLFNKLYKLYKDVRSNSWLSALTFLKFNILKISFNRNLIIGLIAVIKIHVFKKSYTDTEILKLLRK